MTSIPESHLGVGSSRGGFSNRQVSCLLLMALCAYPKRDAHDAGQVAVMSAHKHGSGASLFGTGQARYPDVGLTQTQTYKI